jgi:hypothetical protein
MDKLDYSPAPLILLQTTERLRRFLHQRYAPHFVKPAARIYPRFKLPTSGIIHKTFECSIAAPTTSHLQNHHSFVEMCIFLFIA